MTTKTLKIAVAFGFVALTIAAPAMATPINLVVNGDFSQGNTGFVSEYSYVPQNSTEGEYSVRSNSSLWNPWFVSSADHTGSGDMLLVNGAVTDQLVWGSSEIAVSANTDYVFEAWAMNVCCLPNYPGNNIPAVLRFFANGTELATIAVGAPGAWSGANVLWNSGNATSVSLALRDSRLNFEGNDFAVDDISLSASRSLSTQAEPVPEPATASLLVLGGIAAAWVRHRQTRANARG